MEKINALTAQLKLSPLQLFLAWLQAQGDDIFPIPDTPKASRIDENLLSASVELSQEVIDEIDQPYPSRNISGRYVARLNLEPVQDLSTYCKSTEFGQIAP